MNVSFAAVTALLRPGQLRQSEISVEKFTVQSDSRTHFGSRAINTSPNSDSSSEKSGCNSMPGALDLRSHPTTAALEPPNSGKQFTATRLTSTSYLLLRSRAWTCRATPATTTSHYNRSDKATTT